MAYLPNISEERVFIYFFSLISLVLPGFGIVYNFHHDFFQELDWIRLLFISTYFSMPLFLTSAILAFNILEFEEEKEGSLRQKNYLPFVLSLTSYLSLCVFFLVLWIHLSRNLSIQNFYTISIGIFITLLLLFKIFTIILRLKNKYQSKK